MSEKYGDVRCAIAKDDYVIHLVHTKVGEANPPKTRQPVCISKLPKTSTKTILGEGAVVTEGIGVWAAREIVKLPTRRRHLRMCPGCYDHLSAGMITALLQLNIAA